jgi:peroxiredoxin
VGVSFDSPAENLAWAEEEGFNFELWSDDSRKLAMTYGAASSTSQAFANRITVVLNAEGDVELQYLDRISVGTHPGMVYEDCVQLFGN